LEEFELVDVERIAGERWVRGQHQFMVKYAGFPEPSWQLATDLEHLPDLIAEFYVRSKAPADDASQEEKIANESDSDGEKTKAKTVTAAKQTASASQTGSPGSDDVPQKAKAKTASIKQTASTLQAQSAADISQKIKAKTANTRQVHRRGDLRSLTSMNHSRQHLLRLPNLRTSNLVDANQPESVEASSHNFVKTLV